MLKRWLLILVLVVGIAWLATPASAQETPGTCIASEPTRSGDTIYPSVELFFSNQTEFEQQRDTVFPINFALYDGGGELLGSKSLPLESFHCGPFIGESYACLTDRATYGNALPFTIQELGIPPVLLNDTVFNFEYTSSGSTYCLAKTSLPFLATNSDLPMCRADYVFCETSIEHLNGVMCQKNDRAVWCCRSDQTVTTAQDGKRTCIDRPRNEPNAPNTNLDPFNEPNAATLNALNPLQFSTKADEFATPAGFLNQALNFAFPLAGLLMFLMITWGGFEIVQGATDKKKLDSGKNRIKAAVIGFILLFLSYWITQLVGLIFGVKIL